MAAYYVVSVEVGVRISQGPQLKEIMKEITEERMIIIIKESGEKRIQVFEDTRLKELVSWVQAAFPDSWEEFTLEVVNTETSTTTPIYIERDSIRRRPWWYQPWYTTGNTQQYTTGDRTGVINNMNTQQAELVPGTYSVY